VFVGIWRYKVVKFKAPTLENLVDELTKVRYGKFTHRITEVTKKALNSFEHPVSPSHPAITLPCRPVSSLLIDGYSEASLTGKQTHHGNGKGVAE
jgi:hypothetical protein